MPSKYVVRNFAEDSYYHVFNRGVEKRNIFLEESDYLNFIYYLFAYLQPIEKVVEKYPDTPTRLYGKNLSEEVELVAYCLMPNHFHLLLKQNTKDGVSKLLKQLTNAYTLYFNQKNDRVGGLMQGRFRAVGIDNESLFIHLVRYIHLNPVVSPAHRSLGEGGGITQDLNSYRWSSYGDYLGQSAELPSSKSKILSYFPSVGAFKGFHEDQIDYAKDLEKIKHLAID